MKKILWVGLAIAMTLVISLMIYGAYLNHMGENKIARRLEDRRITLAGDTVKIRSIHPVLHLDTMSLQSMDMADTVSLIDGRIMGLAVQRNDDVEAGQRICLVNNGEYALKIKEIDSRIMEAEANLRQAINDYERYQRLWDREAASKEKLEAMQTAYHAQQKHVEALQAQKQQLLLQESYQMVTAPIKGKVLLIYQTEGSFVKAGTPLVLIGNNGELEFSKTVRDAFARWHAVGEAVEVSFLMEDFQKAYDTSYGVGNRGEKQNFTATVVSVDPPLEQPAEMRRVVWKIDNSSGVLDMKTYRDVELKSMKEHSCLSVSLAAVDDLSSEKSVVYLLDEEGKIQMREVALGVRDGKYVEVLSGLSEGEIVITSGREGLEAGMKATIELE